jgi:hypothetical protein
MKRPATNSRLTVQSFSHAFPRCLAFVCSVLINNPLEDKSTGFFSVAQVWGVAIACFFDFGR